MAPIDLDKTDAKILRALQHDGRMSNLKLAETVHLSPTAALERVKRLTRDGFILGYEARLNPDKLRKVVDRYVFTGQPPLPDPDIIQLIDRPLKLAERRPTRTRASSPSTTRT